MEIPVIKYQYQSNIQQKKKNYVNALHVNFTCNFFLLLKKNMLDKIQCEID